MRAQVDIEERLRRNATAYRHDTDPPIGLLDGAIMQARAACAQQTHGSFAFRELAAAAAIIVFFGLLAFGFSKFHGAPQSAKQGFTPSAKAIPWIASAPLPATSVPPAPVVVSPDQVRALTAGTVTGTTPLLLPQSLPQGMRATVSSTQTSIDVTYGNAAGDRQVHLVTEVPTLPPLRTGGSRITRAFRNDTAAVYQVDDSTHRRLTWGEFGIWNDPSVLGSGVPYALSTTGLSDAEFWRVANSIAPIAPLAPLCRASDVEVTLPGTHALDSGQVALTFVLRNRGRVSCSLSGAPGTLMQFSDGTEALLSAHVPSSGEFGRRVMILAPSSSATAYVTTIAQGCATTLHRTVKDAVIQLLGNAESVPVKLGPGGSTIQVCGTAQGALEATSMGLLEPPAPAERTGRPSMLASTRTPLTAVGGQRLRYEVTVTNQATTPFQFRDCPGYVERLDLAPQTSGHYRLNCAAAGIVLPGASVTFAMVLDLPATTPRERHTLSWTLDVPYAGTTTQALITVTG